MKVKVYTKEQIKTLSGAGESTIQLWSRKLRGRKNMVIAPRKVMYTENFLRFMKTRVGELGPNSMLPAPKDIAMMYSLYEKYDGDVVAISQELNEPEEIVRLKLQEIGL